MTDLNKLLYVARKVWPRKDYVEYKGRIFLVECGAYIPNHLVPHKPTERGKAQLMDIVFTLWEKGILELQVGEECGITVCSAKYNDGEGWEECHTKAEAIINLAADVL